MDKRRNNEVEEKIDVIHNLIEEAHQTAVARAGGLKTACRGSCRPHAQRAFRGVRGFLYRENGLIDS